jgi:OpgC protein
VVRFVPADSRFLFWRITQPINRCGQQSLQIFCLGIVLSVLGHFIIAEWNDTLPAQLAVNATGFALMIGSATLITWYRAIDRATAPP